MSSRISSGPGCRISYVPNGIIISAESGSEYAHPWQVQCIAAPSTDDPTKTEWRAYVRPGFVNGRDVTITSLRAADENSKPTEQEVPLADDVPPYLVLTGWRNPLLPLGFTATLDGEIIAGAGEGYPPFFSRVGVRAAASEGVVDGVQAAAAATDPTRTRELRACDIVLVTPRIAARSDITVQDPLSTGATVSISTVYLNDAVRSAVSPHKLITTSKWNPPREPDAVEWMLGTAVEPQTDEIKIATVWMVSPPDADPDSEPDASWNPYPQNFVFWNLMHASRNEVPSTPQPPVTLQTGLPFADFLSGIGNVGANDAAAQVQALFSAVSLKGEYWSV